MMRCTDGHYYIVKFPANPQGTKTLVNEMLGTRLAERLGLPVAQTRLVYVSAGLIRLTQELVFEMPRTRSPCPAGLCSGSLYQGDPRHGSTWDFLPREYPLQNPCDFLGMLLFDKWTCNTDARQVVYQRIRDEYKAVMIDQGFCFNASEWNFPDAPLRGRYKGAIAYERVAGIASFEPWLTRLERDLDKAALADCAAGIPQEWYGSTADLHQLLDRLCNRRFRVRELLSDMARVRPRIFPNWSNAAAAD